MSAHTVSPSSRKSRAIAWARIKFAGSILITTAGLILMMFALCLLLGLATQFIFKFPHESPVMTVSDIRFDCTTPWGIAVHLLVDLFILAWGWDFVKKGRSMRQAPSSHT